MAKRRDTYATTDGHSYSEISKIMTDAGHKMNTATAREVFLRGLAKIWKDDCSHHGKEITLAEAKRQVSDPVIQEAMQEILTELM